MELKDKLEILIKRNGYKKTDFAAAISITYRALANYISGARTPRAKTLSDMAVLLGVSEELLTDDTVDLILSGDEKLYFNGTSPTETREKADEVLSEVEALLDDKDFTESDKTAFFPALQKNILQKKQKIIKKLLTMQYDGVIIQTVEQPFK